MAPKQRIRSFYFPFADVASHEGEGERYGKAVAIAFSTADQRQMAIYELARNLTSDQLRRALQLESWEDLTTAASHEGKSAGVWLRSRLAEMCEAPDSATLPADARAILEQIATMREVPADTAASPFRGLAPGIEDSPALARYLIETHAPEARSMLDPFAGSGSLVIAGAQRGLRVYWCEIDPVFRFLTKVKIDALTRDRAGRGALADDLSRCAAHVNRVVTEEVPHPVHKASWLASFVGSDDVTIPADAVDCLLRARSWIDARREIHPLVMRCLDAALLTASARFSRRDVLPAEARGVFQEILVDEIETLSSFVVEEKSIEVVPSMICDDALDLEHVGSLRVDLVFTVPPTRSGLAGRAHPLERWCLGLPTVSGQKRDEWLSTTRGHGLLTRGMMKDVELVKAGHSESAGCRLESYYTLLAGSVRLSVKHAAPDATFITEAEQDFVKPVELDIPARLSGLLDTEGFESQHTMTREVRRTTRHARTIERQVLVFERSVSREIVQ